MNSKKKHCILGNCKLFMDNGTVCPKGGALMAEPKKKKEKFSRKRFWASIEREAMKRMNQAASITSLSPAGYIKQMTWLDERIGPRGATRAAARKRRKHQR